MTAGQKSVNSCMSHKKKVTKRDSEYNIDRVEVKVSSSSPVQVNRIEICNSWTPYSMEIPYETTTKQRFRLSHGLL